MSFKKCTSLFLAILLLVSNVGLAFTVHYCEGKIASITSVFNKEEVCEMKALPAQKVCCAKELEANHKKCCKDKIVNLEDKSDEVIVKTFSFQIDIPFTIDVWKPLVFEKNHLQKSNDKIAFYCGANSPPLFKLYSQYIFYA
jgi:hypothetical protein